MSTKESLSKKNGVQNVARRGRTGARSERDGSLTPILKRHSESIKKKTLQKEPGHLVIKFVSLFIRFPIFLGGIYQMIKFFDFSGN